MCVGSVLEATGARKKPPPYGETALQHSAPFSISVYPQLQIPHTHTVDV